MVELTVLFVFGLIVGSFLNVLIWRLNDEKAPKFWQGRSLCPKCKHPLSWIDNIPLLSFLFLKGKCRYCQKKISWQYPLVELITALAMVLVWLITGGQSPIVKLLYCLIVDCFIVIFFSDWVYGLIPDEMIVVGGILGVLGYLGNSGSLGVLNTNLLVGGLTAWGFFLIVWATKFRGMGFGDVKLAFMMGFLLGWPRILVALWSGFILGGAAGLFLLFLKRKGMKDSIPLGPYLVFGTLVAALWTPNLLSLIGF